MTAITLSKEQTEQMDKVLEELSAEQGQLLTGRIEHVLTCGDKALEYILKKRAGSKGTQTRRDLAPMWVNEVVKALAFKPRRRPMHGGSGGTCINTTYVTNTAFGATFHHDYSNCGMAHMHGLNVYVGMNALYNKEHPDDDMDVIRNTLLHSGKDVMFIDLMSGLLSHEAVGAQAYKGMAALLLSGVAPVATVGGDGYQRPTVECSRRALVRFSGPRRGNETYKFGCWMLEHFPEHTMGMPFFSRNPNSGADLMEFAVSAVSLAVQDLPLDKRDTSGANNRMGGQWYGEVTPVGL